MFYSSRLINKIAVNAEYQSKFESAKRTLKWAAHFSDATNAEIVANATRGIIPTYTVMDFSTSYEWKRYRLQAGINNLTNTSYFTRRATGYPGPGIIPAEPRRLYIGLRITI